MLTCYIVDDEQHAVDTLITYIARNNSLSLVGANTDPLIALSELKRLPQIDIAFLDVDMPNISGLELAQLLPAGTAVIFTTAFANHAVEAFNINASDFLMKPISTARFLKAIEKVEKRFFEHREQAKDEQPDLFINPGMRGKIIQVAVRNIVYIEGLKNYVMIYTTNGDKHITYLTMGEIEEALSKQLFYRIHRSYIVNKIHIQSIEGSRIILNNKVELTLGISYRESFMNAISRFILKTKRS
jgi:two-component system LytT family response regulator